MAKKASPIDWDYNSSSSRLAPKLTERLLDIAVAMYDIMDVERKASGRPPVRRAKKVSSYKNKSENVRTMDPKPLEALLEQTGLGYKFLWEMVLPGNMALDIEDCARRDPEKWTEGTWPERWMADLCGLCDYELDEAQQLKLLDLVDSLLPGAYHDMIKNLSVPIMLKGRDSGVLELESPGDRICSSVDLLTGARPTPSKGEALGYVMQRRYTEHGDRWQYWIISLLDFHRIAELYGLSPHWLLVGQKDACVLAQLPITEHIIDRVCFLTEPDKQMIVETALRMATAERRVRYDGI